MQPEKSDPYPGLPGFVFWVFWFLGILGILGRSESILRLHLCFAHCLLYYTELLLNIVSATKKLIFYKRSK